MKVSEDVLAKPEELAYEETAEFGCAGEAPPVSWTEYSDGEPSFAYLFWKRAFDILLSIAGVIVLLPVLAVVAAAIRLESKGPAIFRQERVGKDGKRFVMYKFRSMVRDADGLREDLEHLNECDGPVFKIEKDPRLTRVGAFIRKTSIDELPQLLNIVRGEMSLVGPRPPLPEEVEQYGSLERRRLQVRPGLTCYWQISGRSGLTFQQWMEMDLRYIKERSFKTDAMILFKTIPAVLTCKGAY